MKHSFTDNIGAFLVESTSETKSSALWPMPDESHLAGSLQIDEEDKEKGISKGRPRDIIHSHFIRTPLSRRVTCRYCSKSFNWSNVKHGWRHFSGMRSCRSYDRDKWHGPCTNASFNLVLEARRRIGLYSERAVRRRAPPAPSAVRAFFNATGIDFAFAERPEFAVMCAAIRASSPDKVPKRAEDLRKARADLPKIRFEDKNTSIPTNDQREEQAISTDITRSMMTFPPSNPISRLLNDEPQEPVSIVSSEGNATEDERSSMTSRKAPESGVRTNDIDVKSSREPAPETIDLALKERFVRYSRTQEYAVDGVHECSTQETPDVVEAIRPVRKSFARPRKRQKI